MKTAVLLVGNIRTWEKCKDNFIETIGKYDPDIFLSTYDVRYGYHPAVRNRIGYYDDEVLSRKEIADMFTGLKLRVVDYERLADANDRIYYALEKVHKMFGECYSYYAQYRKMKAAVDIMQKHEYEIGERYGRVIRTRCDLMHNGINFDDVENKILIDSSNVFPNDCFFMTNRNAAVKIAEFMMEEFFDPKYEDSAERPPHQMFLNAIKHNNLDVDVQKVMQCVVRQNQIQYY
jgi:hypothetical protein